MFVRLRSKEGLAIGVAMKADALDARPRFRAQMLRSAAWDSPAEAGLHLARLMHVYDPNRRG